MKMNGGQMLCESLIREGVDVIFGLPGGAILPLYQTLPEFPQLRHILVRHEQGAAHAADGYARVTGRPGVAWATSGPGATNLGYRHRHRADGLRAYGRHHRTGGQGRNRLRRLPGVRHHRHHSAHYQAQLPRDDRRGNPGRNQGGVLHRQHGQTGPRFSWTNRRMCSRKSGSSSIPTR